MKRGFFVVFEGINGCGKGTQLPILEEYVYNLDKANSIFRTREPNVFDDNGERARKMLRGEGNPYSNNSMAVKYFASNRKTHNNIFVPMLKLGINVFSDRYWHSNFAFQGAQGISYEDIAVANKGLRVPDLTFLIDVPVDLAFNRLYNRDGLTRRKFDSNRDFLERVRSNYLELPKILPSLIGDGSMVVVDGEGSIEDAFLEIKNSYDSFLKISNS